MDELNVLVGEWAVEVDFPGAPTGRLTMAWDLDRTALVQRSEVDEPTIPNTLTVITPDGGGGYTQHYFDSRGVVRVYKMTLADGVWTLLRDEPDFSPLDFAQRYRGTISADRNTIDGQWEKDFDGTGWEVDFALRYRRLTG